MPKSKPTETAAIVEVQPSAPLILEGDPEAQLEYAQKASRALMKRVEAKPKKVMINGKQYLEFGDWQTLARFFGATVGTEWSKPIEREAKDGDTTKLSIIGYEARAVVYHHGTVISAAEASCFRAERNWATRDEFAIKSMAQTRASAKALRNAFGWVAELAGYSSTPAEEMDGVASEQKKYPSPSQLSSGKRINATTGEITQSATLSARGKDMLQEAVEVLTVKGISDEPTRRLVMLAQVSADDKYDLTDEMAETILNYATKVTEQELADDVEAEILRNVKATL